MRRAFPWVLSVVLLIALIASLSELQRVKKRFGEATRHAFHDHAEARLAVIRSEMAQETRPIVIIGDSVAERARFPGAICGRPIVNAGIGGATLEELTSIAGEFDAASLVVIIAGTNSPGPGSEEKFRDLLAAVKPPKIAVAATIYPEVNAAITKAATDMKTMVFNAAFSEFRDVHPTPAAYSRWLPQLGEAISEECAR